MASDVKKKGKLKELADELEMVPLLELLQQHNPIAVSQWPLHDIVVKYFIMQGACYV